MRVGRTCAWGKGKLKPGRNRMSGLSPDGYLSRVRANEMKANDSVERTWLWLLSTRPEILSEPFSRPFRGPFRGPLGKCPPWLLRVGSSTAAEADHLYEALSRPAERRIGKARKG